MTPTRPRRRLLRIGGSALLALGHDTVMAGASFALAVILRMGSNAWHQVPQVLMLGSALFTVTGCAVFLATGLYRGVWRYAALDDLFAILRAATLTVLGADAALFVISRLELVPRSSLPLSWVLLVTLLAGPRLGYRLLKDGHVAQLFMRSTGTPKIPVLLIGAGNEADLFIREMTRNPQSNYRVIGLIDDKKRRIGQAIRGVPVLGTADQLPAIIDRLSQRNLAPQRLILTRDRTDPALVRDLFEIAEHLALPLARLPRLTEFRGEAGAHETRIEVQPIAIEDLLGRPQTPLDRTGLVQFVHNRRVMVTGAGGSIGAELVRQLAELEPSRLILVDHSEFALYSIDLQLAERFPEIDRAAVLASVRDRKAVAAIFATERPELVFHAAALKHVPMVEANPEEGILTNVVGTRIVADLAAEFGSAAMVLISTDKAVNPTNVMGATKRLAESWCQTRDLAERQSGDETRYITVRFGNVLGSTGSVVPLFERQLRRGGPLTVTHPDITRYFMTVREAVELVLHAASHGIHDDTAGGKIFVLDMGEPVRIVDLARQMIRLAGLRLDRDIEIRFTGLRPGEKLHEELFHNSEPLIETKLGGIRLASPRLGDGADLARALDVLENAARSRDRAACLAALRDQIPEFTLEGA